MDLPEKFTQRMKKMLGGEYGAFIAALETAPLYSGLRVNSAKAGARGTVMSAFPDLTPVPWCADGFYADKTAVSGNHPYHAAGLFYFQEPSAMAAVAALPIEEGDFVLDLCAAPGGKSTQAGAALRGTGLLVSNEIVPNRAAVLSGNIERMGLTNAVVTNEMPQRLAEKYPEFFDKIIVDAPCSGEGMFRKEPRAAEEWSAEHVASCAERQHHILSSAVKMLKKGGMLLYSTCTFSPEENEENAAYLIKTHGLELCETNLDMLDCGINSLTDIDVSQTRRIFPHKQRGEGHFIALFKKDGAPAEAPPKKSAKPDPDLNGAVSLYREFENISLKIRLDGDFRLFGDNLYLLPQRFDIDKIKVLRYGLHLGVCRKNRFEPAHALALALNADDFKSAVNFASDSAELHSYLQGNVIECDKNGWTAVLADGFPIGWGKASGGVLKNRYPKALRLK